jgi:hypothetical protein
MSRSSFLLLIELQVCQPDVQLAEGRNPFLFLPYWIVAINKNSLGPLGRSPASRGFVLFVDP